MNLRLAAKIASAALSGVALTDLESGSGTIGTPEVNHGGTPGQVPVQTGETGLPRLPAQSYVARGSREIERLGMSLEDWFESSLPTEHASGSDVSKPAVPTQLNHASLIHADLKALDGGLNTGEIAPGQPLNIFGGDPGTLTHQLPAAKATAEAVTAKAALESHQPGRSGMGLDNRLMKEIPLLFAPVPLEPQQESIGMGFKAVVMNGMLMSGAVLAVILLTTVDLEDLHIARAAVLTVLTAIGVLYLILRRVRRHRR